MATTATRKNAQNSPAATTDTTLYTVPAATDTVVSKLVVANTNATPQKYRVHHRLLGVAVAQTNALAYDVSIPGNSVDVIPLQGLVLQATDVISVRADATNVVFTLGFQENT